MGAPRRPLGRFKGECREGKSESPLCLITGPGRAYGTSGERRSPPGTERHNFRCASRFASGATTRERQSTMTAAPRSFSFGLHLLSLSPKKAGGGGRGGPPPHLGVGAIGPVTPTLAAASATPAAALAAHPCATTSWHRPCSKLNKASLLTAQRPSYGLLRAGGWLREGRAFSATVKLRNNCQDAAG